MSGLEGQCGQEMAGGEVSALTRLSTEASITTEYGKVVVTVYKRDLSLPDLIDHVIEPLLLGVGYSQGVIDEYFRG